MSEKPTDERKNLSHDRESFRSLIDGNPDGVIVVNDDGKILFANPAATSLLGKTPESVIGQSFDLPVSAGKSAEIEIKTADGETRIAERRVSQITWEGEKAALVAIRDVTERKREWDEAKESDNLYRLLAENISDVIWTMDLNLRQTYVSPSVERMTGFTVEERMRQTLEEMIVPGSLKTVFEAFKEEMEIERSDEKDIARSRHFELELYRKDGSTIWMETETTFLRDAAGRPVGILGVGRDITDRKRAEEQLKNATKEWRTTFDSMQDCLMLIDLDREIIRVNKAMAELFGLPFDNIIGKKCFELVHGTSSPPDYCPCSLTLKDDSVHRAEVFEPHLEGYFSIATSPHIDDTGNRRGTVHIMRDITDRKTAEENLRNSEAKYRNLVDFYPDIIISLNRDGQLVSVNKAAEGISGYSREEMLGRYFYELEFISRDDIPKLLNEFAMVLTEKRRPPFEFAITASNGQEIFLEANTNVINDDGDNTGILVILRDITDQRKLKEQLNHAIKMEAIGRLAGGVAHDFNNILSIIISYASFAMEELAEGDPLFEDVYEIKEAANRASKLTRQLLTFSRKDVTKPQQVNLNDAVVDMFKMLKRLIGEDIELKVIPAENLGPIKADPSHIEQVALNLAVNARDAMPQGGELIIETKNVVLDDEYQKLHPEVKPGEYVMLAVADNGVGMTPEVKERIFEPFFTTKREERGTGLGLATIYGIVKQAGGHIFVYSEPGRGTTFKIYFPVTTETLAKQEEERVVPVAHEATETILLVEDDDSVRRITGRILKQLGYTVLDARSGGDALLLAEQHEGPIDLLLTDVVMPRMAGRELAERMRAIRPDIKVLYMSGYTDNFIESQQLISGEIILLQKPFSREDLVQKISEALYRG